MSTLITWFIVIYVIYLVLKVLGALLEDSVTYEEKLHEERNLRATKKTKERT